MRSARHTPSKRSAHDSGIDKLAGLRRVPVKGFEKYLLFYIPRIGGIDIVRVLHSARDIQGIFGSEEI
ncbi:MAG TPA: hypothetical protein VIX89_18915 [Bryobacteraceae bacterium]